MSRANELIERFNSLSEAKEDKGVKSSVKVGGKTYKTIMFTSIDAANRFMEKNTEYGVIDSDKDNTEIHVALLSDKGESLEDNETLEEAVDVKAIIKEVIDTDWSKDNDQQMKVVQLLKGIATSEDPMSNKFMKKLDDFTSSLKIEDFE